MSNETKVTAVEWYAVKDGELTIQYLEGKINGIELAVKKTKYLDQAIAMEKQQIIDAHIAGFTSIESEQYYTENYGK